MTATRPAPEAPAVQRTASSVGADPAILAALPTRLPVIERRAAIPGGFLAAGGVAGIKASGRPDLAIVATTPGRDGTRTQAAAAAVFTPNAFAAAPVRLSQTHLAATEPAGEGRYGWATAVISTS